MLDLRMEDLKLHFQLVLTSQNLEVNLRSLYQLGLLEQLLLKMFSVMVVRLYVKVPKLLSQVSKKLEISGLSSSVNSQVHQLWYCVTIIEIPFMNKLLDHFL